MNKKNLSVIMAAAMISTSVAPVFAAETTQVKKETITKKEATELVSKVRDLMSQKYTGGSQVGQPIYEIKVGETLSKLKIITNIDELEKLVNALGENKELIVTITDKGHITNSANEVVAEATEKYENSADLSAEANSITEKAKTETIKLYGGKTIEKLMKRTSSKENTAIESKALTRAIERAQKGVEGKNFEIRKNVLKYDDTINEQRKVIYNERNKVLNDEDIKEDIQKMVKDIIQEAGETYLIGRKRDYYGYFKHLYSTFMPADTLLIPGVDKKSVQEIIDSTYEISKRVYDLKKMMIGIDKVAELEKTVLLKVVDQYWIDHIDAMEQLRQYIGLKSYAQKDPFKEYALEGYDMFEALNKNIREATVQYLYKFN
ncbi:protein translocase subunit secA 2 [Clostridioides difficile]|nr:protein translocase subunit secA 2 [Clostridioides difficile]